MKALDDKKIKSVLSDNNSNFIIEETIFKAFMLYSDEIKENTRISDAFESILNILINHSCDKAAVILDEYRIH